MEELVEQFSLLSVLPFRDREENVFQDLAIVPLILITSTVTVMLPLTHTYKTMDIVLVIVCTFCFSFLRVCTCASASLDSWKLPHCPASGGGTPEAEEGKLICLMWSNYRSALH